MAGCTSVRTSKMKAHCSSLAKPRSGVRFYVSGHIKASKAMPHTCLSDCGNAVMIIIIIIIITHCSHFKKKIIIIIQRWLNPMSLGPPARQVLQQSLPILTRRKSMPTLAVSTSSLQSRLKPWDL